MRKCTKCKQTKELMEFDKCKRTKIGRQSRCKVCKSLWYQENRARIRKKANEAYLKNKEEVLKINKEYYNKNKIQILSKCKEYRQKNLEKCRESSRQRSKLRLQTPEGKRKHRHYQAARRAILLKATPLWANLTKIKEIYMNCPDGYHVDHIVPLQGKNVCGLHVENNLQYLPAAENLSKSNKWEV